MPVRWIPNPEVESQVGPEKTKKFDCWPIILAATEDYKL